jgi:CheY-like chemotaxis protein
MCSKEEGKGNGVILIVDDDEQLLNFYQELFEMLGLKTLSARNGKEGVEKFIDYKEEIRCVILDSVMPVMNGRDALLRIKTINPLVPVIIITGYSEEFREKNGHDKIKPEAIINKPIKCADIKKKLSEVLGEKIGNE